MTKTEMTILLRGVGVNENTVTAMENAYDMGVEFERKSGMSPDTKLYTIPPQRTNERVQAFQKIAVKIESMPFNDDTMDSLVLWLKDQA